MQPIFIDLPMCEPAGEFLAPPIGGYGGDYCYAAPCLVRAAVLSNVVCKNLNPRSEQSGMQIINILKNFGAVVKRSGESVQVSKSALKAAAVDISDCRRLAPICCVLAMFAKGRSVVTGFKGSEQLLLSLEISLKNLGARCEAGPDRLWIWKCERISDAVISAGDNIYMAMAFITLASMTKKQVAVRAPAALLQRYPGFLEQFGYKI